MGIVSILLGAITFFLFTGAGAILANTLVEQKQTLSIAITSLKTISDTSLMVGVVGLFAFIGLLIGVSLIIAEMHAQDIFCLFITFLMHQQPGENSGAFIQIERFISIQPQNRIQVVFYPQVDTPVSAVRKFDLMLIDSGFEWIRRTEKIPQTHQRPPPAQAQAQLSQAHAQAQLLPELLPPPP